MKILMTAALGVVGRGIANSIRISKNYKDSYLIGTDIIESKYGLNSGLYDKIIKSPSYKDEGFLEFILKQIEKEKPNAVLINHELEIYKLSDSTIPLSVIPNKSFAQVSVSKKRLFETLSNSEFIPRSYNFTRTQFQDLKRIPEFNGRVWIRDASQGTTGGKGAFCASSSEEINEWVKKNEGIKQIQLSEYLPGRNLACCLLYGNGELKSAVCAERQSYFLSDLVPSGVTGFCDKGLIFYDKELINTCKKIVSFIPGSNHLNGVITLDLKEDENGNPKLTEINLRYVGLVQAYAMSGFNIVENHLNLITNKSLKSYNLNSKFEFFRSMDGPVEVYNLSEK